MTACILCREVCASSTRLIEIFSVDGVRMNISSIISKHFWLKPKSEFSDKQSVCLSCWESVSAFHEFYQRVAEAHNHLEEETKDVLTADVENDPFGNEVVLKSEELSSAGQLVEALGENFFDSEIKVEVHDLDLLPQIEIIEENANFSQRTQRANRRGRPPKEKPASETAAAVNTKRIKREKATTAKDDADDSDHELPLAALINATNDTKVEEPAQASVKESESLKDDLASGAAKAATSDEPVVKKKRGRPKKVKETPPNEETQSSSTTLDNQKPLSPIKAEKPTDSSSDDAGDTEFMSLSQHTAGTDDSSDSSSSSDSENSLPDVEPPEQYAEIPKRVVVKPKKYRKRQKPLVPPKRMTREEIEQKNALQAEYDRILKQFFEKFNCPKCNLLVVDFGAMKKHFNASHNDSGYLLCCGKKFFQRKSLVEHIYVHWNPEHFKCSKCDKICQDSRTLEAHELSHTQPPEAKEKKTFQCDKCPKFFTTKAAFEYHSFSKHVPKSEFKFTCPECKKKLPTERKLKDHLKYMHDPESAIICDKCGKQMRSQSNLKKHHEIEHSEVPRPVPVPMQCEICGTWLRHAAGLKQHMKTIHEESVGEHRCHICNKTSTNARALKRHIYHNHECERKFKCTMCEKAFKRPQDLREHTSTHTGEVLYTCPNCPMTFFSNANMYKHRQRLHRAEWERDRKKPRPPNIMQQAVEATASMKMQQAVGAASAFFANKAAEMRLNLDIKDNFV